MAYRVDLPVFSGPLDLLLHLIKQQEVDIHEVAIAGILERYLEHLDVLQQLDLADIGEFLVMASTLMEIKSRELLPSEEIELEEELDPRDDLIRRLLEYKRFRDAARRFDRMSQRRSRMLAAHLPMPKQLVEAEDPEPELDLDRVEVWALTAAFAKLLRETGGAADDTMRFGVDRRNVRYYTAQILDRVRHGREVPFEALFERAEGRMALIGVFTATLELMKQGYLKASQPECFGPIVVVYRGPADLRAEDLSGEGFDETARAVADGESDTDTVTA